MPICCKKTSFNHTQFISFNHIQFISFNRDKFISYNLQVLENNLPFRYRVYNTLCYYTKKWLIPLKPKSTSSNPPSLVQTNPIQLHNLQKGNCHFSSSQIVFPQPFSILLIPKTLKLHFRNSAGSRSPTNRRLPAKLNCRQIELIHSETTPAMHCKNTNR